MGDGKKNIGQIVMLVALLGVMVFLVVRMVRIAAPHPSPAGPVASATAAAAPAAKYNPNETPSATNMPPVTGSQGDKVGSAQNEPAADLHQNPDQFKVFALSPPKNPFVQQEGWYSGVLQKELPGYPQLKGNGYFDQHEAYLPDVPAISSGDWAEARVERSVKKGDLDITGTSTNGDVTTHIQLTPKEDEGGKLEWRADTGIPFSALQSPTWRKRYGTQLAAAMGAKRNTEKKPGDGDLFGDGLSVPGSAAGMRSGVPQGDAIYCVGVNLHGQTATALLRLNGQAHLVQEGSILPTHYKVLHVTDSGVLVEDLNDKSSHWLPLGAAPLEQKDASKAKQA